jgi:hypothetical protein
LKDLGSVNGTFLNSRGSEHEVPLTDGDIITVGNIQMRFVTLDAHEIDDDMLAQLTTGLEQIVIDPVPEAEAQRDDLYAENRRLRQFQAACRAVLTCKDVKTVMAVALIAAEELGDATSSRIRLKHASGAATEQTRGGPPPSRDDPDGERPWPRKSGVLRITGADEKVTTELAVPIMGRGTITGALWLTRKGPMRHLEHSLLKTVCDLISVVLASLEKR